MEREGYKGNSSDADGGAERIRTGTRRGNTRQTGSSVAANDSKCVAAMRTSGHCPGWMPTIKRRALTQRSATLADGISSRYESLAIRISLRYVTHVINSFKGKFAEPILQGRVVPKGFPANLAKVARRKLIMVDAAAFLEALNSPPGNRLEALKGDLAGKHSIRIN
ncbi:MAG TPA: type II toxin-antitoxin system RelE/ParE family toxin, partial [Bradyrhizobium sp.]|nr:type II toxin-antitoxin system RelE/ParE family toxin [Bradyrhizobium sp.]